MREQIQKIIGELNEVLQQSGDDTVKALCVTIVMRLEAAIRPQWVPVAERLPEHSLSVMVLDSAGNMDTAWHGGGSWREYYPDPYAEITHWHEIDYPEPPAN